MVLERAFSCQTSRYSDWLRAVRSRGRSSSPGRVKNFLFSTSPRPALGSTQPPIQWVPWALSPWVKRPRREADHSSPTSAEVKKMCIYTSSPPYAYRDNFTFYFHTVPLYFFKQYSNSGYVHSSSLFHFPPAAINQCVSCKGRFCLFVWTAFHNLLPLLESSGHLSRNFTIKPSLPWTYKFKIEDGTVCLSETSLSAHKIILCCNPEGKDLHIICNHQTIFH
jgi:hypothetical protein